MKKVRKYLKKSLPRKITDILVTYAKTQLLLIAVVTLVSWMILSTLGVQFALLLALMTGAASVIPILGMLAAGIIVSVVAIFDASRFLPALPGVFEGIVILVIYAFMNATIDYFLSPYLIGKSTKVNPFLLLVLVLIGTSVFGMWGAFLTIPAALVIKTVGEHYEGSGTVR